MVEILYKIVDLLSGGELSSLQNSKKELEQSKTGLTDKVKRLETTITELTNNVTLLENTTKEKETTIYTLENQIQSLNQEKTDLTKTYETKISQVERLRKQNDADSNKILESYKKEIAQLEQDIQKVTRNQEFIYFLKTLEPYEFKALREYVSLEKSDLPIADKLHSPANIKGHHTPPGFDHFVRRIAKIPYITHITRTGNMYHDKYSSVKPKQNGEIELSYVNNGMTTFMIVRTTAKTYCQTCYVAVLLEKEIK